MAKKRKAIQITPAMHFIADTHFSHRLMISDRKQDDGTVLPRFRPFDDLDKHDQHLIDNWNKVVMPGDTVYHLGDFGWFRAGKKRLQHIFDQLAGVKILLPGNHDDSDILGLGWSDVLLGPQNFVEPETNQLVVAMHWPMYEWDGWYRSSVHIHGHTHNNRRSSRRRFDVGVDHIGSFPMTWSEIRDKMANLPELDIDGVALEPFKADRGYPQPSDPLGRDTRDFNAFVIEMANHALSGEDRDAIEAEIAGAERRLGLPSSVSRADAARFSVANTELAGGSVSPETVEALERWKRGEIDDDGLIAEIRINRPKSDM